MPFMAGISGSGSDPPGVSGPASAPGGEPLSQPPHFVLVTHRLASVRRADRIYVLDRGKVIEQGTHATLMALNGRYA